MTLKLTFMEIEISLPALRHGELDLLLGPFQASRYEDLVEVCLFEDEFVVYASASHRLAKKKEVTLADLAQERWAVAGSSAPSPQRLRQAFLEAGLSMPEIAVESNSLPLKHQILLPPICWVLRPNAQYLRPLRDLALLCFESGTSVIPVASA